MVGLPISQPNRQPQADFAAVLLSLCKQLQSLHAVKFDVSFQPGIELNRLSQPTTSLVSQAVTEAATAAEPRSTIDIAIHHTRRGTEIEIIACSESGHQESRSAFCRERIIIGRGHTSSLFRARCPDGSLAWIIVQSQLTRLRHLGT